MSDNLPRPIEPPGGKTPSAAEDSPGRIGRALFLVCGGLLLSILVSCACGPVR